jgi:CBS domain-containing protein
MGFEAYEYEDGKRDWGSFGLPRDGKLTEIPSAGEVARRDVPTCTLDDDLRAVRRRVRDEGWDTCFVVTDDRVVLGRLGRRALASDGQSTVEDAMSEGPSTVRPSIGIDALIERMDERDLTTFPVTTPDGRLVGLVRRTDAEKALASGSRSD